MASVQVTLEASTALSVPLGAQSGRVVVTQVGSPAEVYITTDGSTPVVSTDVDNPTTQTMLVGELGAQTVVQPPFPGGHMANTVIGLLSAGTPVVQLEW